MKAISDRAARLRLATAGSVDDGKSTLVGRLLHDTGTVPADQLHAAGLVSRANGLGRTDLALLTDGLRAEREQGITIDVAYRYFSTPRRRFVLADTPGHVEFTRNMVTGASTAHVAVILVDARHGVVEQTRRHVAIAALLRVPRLVLAVNKMDLVGYEEAVFAAIVADFERYAARQGVARSAAIPVCALNGDNVVEPSCRMDWYTGPTLLEYLHDVPIPDDDRRGPARLPIQCVIRPRTAELPDYRGYAGRLESGRLSVGDEVLVLPSGRGTKVVGLEVLGRAVDTVVAGQSLTVCLEDDLDVGRGDMVVAAVDAPALTRDLRAVACQVADRPLRAGDRVLLKHTTHTVTAVVAEVVDRLEVSTGQRIPHPAGLDVNDIGTVVLRTAAPLAADGYSTCRATGSFLLIDPADGSTRTAGMVLANAASHRWDHRWLAGSAPMGSD